MISLALSLSQGRHFAVVLDDDCMQQFPNITSLTCVILSG